MPHRSRVPTPPTGDEPDWSDPATIRAVAKLELAQRLATERYSTDPWAFVSECVSTLDQITGTVRRMPKKAHLEYLTRLWLQEPLLLVPKSRRMIVTWLFCALYYWLARYRPHAKIAFLARKEGRNESEGSAELVWRARFIHEHLPPLLGSVPVEYHFCRLAFLDNGSEILGIPDGADQLRQMTLTGVLADELGFWDHAYETYVSLRPTIEGGGRFTGVSSANPGFFKALVNDEVSSLGAF